jgi:hypothetical protein
VRLTTNDDSELFNKLTEVRKSFAGDYGIYEVLQDSLGGYMWKKGNRLLSYSEYCNKLLDSSTYYWYLRPIVFTVIFIRKRPKNAKG